MFLTPGGGSMRRSIFNDVRVNTQFTILLTMRQVNNNNISLITETKKMIWNILYILKDTLKL